MKYVDPIQPHLHTTRYDSDWSIAIVRHVFELKYNTSNEVQTAKPTRSAVLQ